jgi:hypothetical protein
VTLSRYAEHKSHYKKIKEHQMDIINGFLACWQVKSAVNNAVDQAKDSLVEGDEKQEDSNTWFDNVQDKVDNIVDAPNKWAQDRKKKKHEKDRQQYKAHTDNLKEKYNLDERRKKKKNEKKGWW